MDSSEGATCQHCGRGVSWSRSPADAGHAAFVHDGTNLTACSVAKPAPRFRRLEGLAWVRYEGGGHVHVVSGSDLSPEHRQYPGGYDSECSWCWLNAPHSEAAHALRRTVGSGPSLSGEWSEVVS